MKKAILIDVDTKEIKEVTIEDGIDAIYKQLKCDTFDVIRLDNKNDIYVDDNGVLSITPDTKFFKHEDYHQPIAGNGLVMGFDFESGDSVDTTITVKNLKSKITFMTLHEVQTLYGNNG